MDNFIFQTISELNPQRAARSPDVRIRDVYAHALSCGAIIIDPENSVRPLHLDTLRTASEEALATLYAARLEDTLQEVFQGSALSDLLTKEALHDWLQYTVKSLHCRAKGLRLDEIRTEVLLSLSSDLNSSSSSSVQDGESVGEVATPSRAETVVPDGGSVTEGGA